MKFLYTLLVFLLSQTALIAQATAEVDPYRLSGQGSVEIPASFPRGTKAMVDYLNHKLQYPPKAKAKKHGGYSFIQFTIEKDGTLTKFVVLEGLQPKPAIRVTDLDEEALRVSKSMPQWIPAKNKGENVEISFILAIKFTPDK